MEQTKLNESSSKSTPVSGQQTSDDDPWEVPLSALVGAYPNHFILQYVIVPTTLHIWWTPAGVTAVAFTYYRVCRGFWSTECTCSSRTYYFLFAIECGLVAMTGYTYYLKAKLVDERSRSRSRRK
ncbi:hypothetical protein Q7P35_011011 [Cladosporium inversicolor]